MLSQSVSAFSISSSLFPSQAHAATVSTPSASPPRSNTNAQTARREHLPRSSYAASCADIAAERASVTKSRHGNLPVNVRMDECCKASGVSDVASTGELVPSRLHKEKKLKMPKQSTNKAAPSQARRFSPARLPQKCIQVKQQQHTRSSVCRHHLQRSDRTRRRVRLVLLFPHHLRRKTEKRYNASCHWCEAHSQERRKREA